jgi:flagellar protein FliL
MSEKEAPAAAAPAAPADKGKKSGVVGVVVALVVTAVLSGGAAYGGARAASGPPKHEEPKVVIAKPPGPTIQLDPFVVNVSSADGKPHAVKLTIAIELGHTEKEDAFKVFVPRVRNTTLGYLRGLTFEDLADRGKVEAIRNDLRERIHNVGAIQADQILITDLLTQ